MTAKEELREENARLIDERLDEIGTQVARLFGFAGRNLDSDTALSLAVQSLVDFHKRLGRKIASHINNRRFGSFICGLTLAGCQSSHGCYQCS